MKLPRTLIPMVTIGLLLGPTLAWAQAQSGAQSVFIDPSIRASGMGRTGVAVSWGGDPNDWANPALLSDKRGVRYEWGKAQLVPDLADDVYFNSKRVTVGVQGIGIALAGKPFGDVGHLRLDYGTSEATDADGNSLGQFTAFEEIHTFGIGLSAMQMVNSIMRFAGHDQPEWTQYADISIGHTWKSVAVDLGPVFYGGTGVMGGEAKVQDWGLLVRVTPIRAGHGTHGASNSGSDTQVDMSFGWSQQNYNDATISYGEIDQSDPIVQDSRVGFAVHATFSPSRPVMEGESADGRELLRGLITPLVAIGATYERSTFDLGSDHIQRTGAEVTIANILSARVGYIDDPQGMVQAATWGFGIGLGYQGVAGMRYDFASTPQARGLDNVSRDGMTAFIDPIALWKRLNQETP